MRKQILLCLIFASLFSSCSVKLTQERFNTQYIAAKSKFADSLTNIFPKQVDAHFSELIGSIGPSLAFEYGHFTGLILCVPYSDTLVLSLRNKLYKIKYSSTDENLLIVGRLGESTDEEYEKWEQNYDKNKDYVPVPNFYRLNYDTDTFASDRDPLNNKLPEGYTIYVVDAYPGVFIKEEWLTQGKGLPKEWKNGYSRGYAISKDKSKNIVYWLIVW